MADPFPNHTDCAECPWREHLEAEPSKDAGHIATEIVALINARPRTPTHEEFAAIIAKSFGGASAVLECRDDSARTHIRAEWDALLAKQKATSRTADDDEFDALCSSVDDCARRILATPVHGFEALKLLAAAVHWVFWTDPDGITDDNLNSGPAHYIDDHEGGLADTALTALLKAIRDLDGRKADSAEARA